MHVEEYITSTGKDFKNSKQNYEFLSISSLRKFIEDWEEIKSKENFFTDEDNYNYALTVFEKEEGRKPNMNNEKDMNIIAVLETGIRYGRL
jgi:hypothetical protein